MDECKICNQYICECDIEECEACGEYICECDIEECTTETTTETTKYINTKKAQEQSQKAWDEACKRLEDEDEDDREHERPEE